MGLRFFQAFEAKPNDALNEVGDQTNYKDQQNAIVAAALVQSRWAYLMGTWDENVQKWHRIRGYLSSKSAPRSSN